MNMRTSNLICNKKTTKHGFNDKLLLQINKITKDNQSYFNKNNYINTLRFL